MSCLNDHHFLDPDARKTSREFAMRGIGIPDEIKLRPGQILFRLGHSTSSYDQGVAGAWWMTDATFDYITRTAFAASDRRPDKAVRDMMRTKLALLPSFGPSDVVIRATVAGALRAWTGRGKLVSDAFRSVIGAFEVAQLCIPGLLVEKSPKVWVKSPGYDDMLTNVRTRSITSYASQIS